jgi:hypothetical protein
MTSRKGDPVRRPQAELAHHFDTAFCGEPTCGLHMTARREDGSPICEIVVSREGTLALIEHCKDNLYAKIVNGDDS